MVLFYYILKLMCQEKEYQIQEIDLGVLDIIHLVGQDFFTFQWVWKVNSTSSTMVTKVYSKFLRIDLFLQKKNTTS